MPFETRAKRREPVEAVAEYAIHESTEKAIKLNLPRQAVESEGREALFIKSSLIDVSVIGCALDSEYLMPPGVMLDIKIDRKPFLGEGEGEKDAANPIRILGRVTSCVMRSPGHYRLGIFFAKIDKADVDIIEKFIASKERRKAPRWDMTK